MMMIGVLRNIYLQFSGVQWYITWNLLETSGRTIHRRPFTMTCRRTFGVDATFTSESCAIFVVAWKNITSID